jgi:hypothetical protein
VNAEVREKISTDLESTEFKKCLIYVSINLNNNNISLYKVISSINKLNCRSPLKTILMKNAKFLKLVW